MQLTWNYNAIKNITPDDIFTQKDWTQTLITRINQLSAQIYQNTHMGDANKIKINEKLLPLLSDLKYFKINENGDFYLAGKYHIIIDNNVAEDIVLIYHESELILNAKKLNKVVCLENIKKENSIYYELKFFMVDFNSDEYHNVLNNPNVKVITDKEISAEIKILNYAL